MKNIVICLDGTWNKPGDEGEDADKETNVCNLYQLCVNNRDEQVAYYDEGVGSHWYDRIRGGITGWGLSENIRQAYQFLSATYQPGDKLFIFGFSRGAYTARSLAGLLYSCGVPKKRLSEKETDDIFCCYQRETRDEQKKLKKNQNACPVEVLGVWDTVGALGIPVGFLKKITDHFLEFHDAKLNPEVKGAYHAVAIDEQRETFKPTLWDARRKKPGQRMEQVWFAGVHSDVGGGYLERFHSDIAFQWMMDRAVGHHGLLVDDEHPYEYGFDLEQDIHDSYKIFFGKRSPRRASIEEENVSIIHRSVKDKLGVRPDYTPLALSEKFDKNTFKPYMLGN